MLALLRFAVNKLTPGKEEIRVLLLGLERSGKTRLQCDIRASVFGTEPSARHKEEDDEREREQTDSSTATVYTPTTGSSVARGKYSGSTWCVTDVGGSERQRRAWVNYYGDTAFILWVVDAAAQDRLSESAEALNLVLADPDLEHCGVCVVAPRRPSVANLSEAQIAAAFGGASTNRDFCVVSVEGSAACALAAAQWLARTVKTKGTHFAARRQLIAKLAAEQQSNP